MNNEQITHLEDIQKIISLEPAVLVYFNTQSCSVGEVFLPKVDDLLQNNFPKIKKIIVDINISPEISAYFSVFVEPTIIVFYDEKETIRKSRNIGIHELKEAIDRPYKLFFQ